MDSLEVRQKYLDYFRNKGHVSIPPAPLIPEDDSTTLFTGSGMQQLVPYLKGGSHPMGRRLVDYQPCVRVEDIEEIGDNRHTTYFEMLGNWSLGDYFKKEQLPWFFEFLTDVVGLNPDRLYVSVFEGNKDIPRDDESIKIWKDLFKTKGEARSGKDGFNNQVKIYTYGVDENWWSRAGAPKDMPTGEIGGPDSEVFYDFGPELKLHENSPFKNQVCHINCNCGRFLEIGNSVFMEHIKSQQGFEKLSQQNVDFGGGLERIVAVSQNLSDIFKIGSLSNIIKKIEQKIFCGHTYSEDNVRPAFRILADHIRAITFLLSGGVVPSNKGRGYVLRRLIRRAVLQKYKWGRGGQPISCLMDVVVSNQDLAYPKIKDSLNLKDLVDGEEEKFTGTLRKAFGVWHKKKKDSVPSVKEVFDFITVYGLPLEIIKEELGWKGDYGKLSKLLESHQELSRTSSKGMFKGGLADNSKEVTKLHTATHLLHEALRVVLGSHVKQMGSNITNQRLRFDFSHLQKMSNQEIKKVQDLVNEKIKQGLEVKKEEMLLKQALESGALALFGAKYPEKVSVYTIVDDHGEVFSKEICAGPHCKNTAELGRFKIKKEESLASGIRRIRAILEDK